MKIRCPHCCNPVEIIDDSSFTDVPCPTCGSSFSLVSDAETVDLRSAPVPTLSHFVLQEKLGVGAFGTVWKALDSDLDRTVAIKIPRRGQLSNEDTAVFLREAQAAAQLKHPAIVSVHEVGREDETVYIVSDFIDGLTLEDFIAKEAVSPSTAAQLTLQIADAIQHAHDHGVIHRDLKPSNVMVDADGRVHVMDFGLAKRDAGEVTVTMDGRIVGTPAYMSPEQAQGNAHAADARSDVYSLGVVLFKLLTGEKPFRGNQRMLIYQVVHDDPPSPRKLNNRISRDLETICLKCLQKSPANRYATAAALRDDLARAIAGKPIQARPVGQLERIWKWSRRNPAQAAAWVTGVIASLALVAASVSWGYQGRLESINVQLHDANEELKVYQTQLETRNELLAEQNGQLANLRDAEEQARLEALKQLEEAKLARLEEKLAREELAILRYANDMQLAGRAWDEGDLALFEGILDRNQDVAAGIKRWEWEYLTRLRQSAHSTIPGRDACYSPDGRLLAVARDSGTSILNASTMEPALQLEGHPAPSISVGFSGDGTRLIAACNDHRFRVWEVQTGFQVQQLTGHEWQGRAVLNQDGSFALTMGLADDRSVKLWNVETGKIIFEQRVENATYPAGLAFSPDGQYFAVGWPPTHSVWFGNVDTPEQRLDLPLPEPTSYFHTSDPAVCFEAVDGSLLASLNGVVHRVSIESLRQSLTAEQPLPEFERLRIRGTLLAVTSDGQFLATSDPEDRSTCFWHLPTQRIVNRIKGQVGNAERLSFRMTKNDGQPFAIWGSYTGSLVRKPFFQRVEYTEVYAPFAINHVCYSPDGRMLAGAGYQGKVGLYDGQRWRMLPGASGPMWDIVFDPTSAYVAATSTEGAAYLWNTETGELVHRLEVEGVSGLYGIAISPTGKRVAAAGESGVAVVWDLLTGEEIERIKHGESTLYHVAFEPKTGRLVTNGDFRVRYWGKDSFALEPHINSALEFTPDGRQFVSVTGRIENDLRLLNARTGNVEVEFKGHFATVSDAVLMPDGSQLISVGDTNGQQFGTGTMRIWDVRTGQEVLRLPSGGARSVSVSPDGKSIAVSPMTGGVRIYRTGSSPVAGDEL